MKKLYRRGTVHPSPPITTDHLSFLPATILTLAAALSPEDREVLAYLISCSNNDFGNFSTHRKNASNKNPTKRSISTISSSSSDHDHPPLFTCDCFRCYMSYWVRWDSSPNRQLIHEIIDAFEDELAQSKKTKSSKKDRKKKGGGGGTADGSGGLKRPELSLRKDESSELKSAEEHGSSSSSSSGGGGGDVFVDDEEEGTEKGSVRRFVSFIGERIWNVWGQ